MYGLIGKTLVHSYSKDYFTKKFKNEDLNESYELLPIPEIGDLALLLERHPDLKGLNVTIPYKQQVIPFLDELSPDVSEIGAVNVIKINRNDGKITLKGFNSDWVGFRDSLVPLLHKDVNKALILGTGGASKAVAFVLKNLGIDFSFVSRNPGKGQLGYEDLTKEILDSHLLIINTTPLGTYPDFESCAPIPYEFISNNHVCYDLVYNPSETEFLKRSKKRGAVTKNGYEMWERQALESWRIWNS